jgi:hypothetical protein
MSMVLLVTDHTPPAAASVSVATDPNDLTTEPYGGAVLSTEQSLETPSQDGNNAVIGLEP